MVRTCRENDGEDAVERTSKMEVGGSRKISRPKLSWTDVGNTGY